MPDTQDPLPAFPLLAGLRPEYQTMIADTAQDVSCVKRQRLFTQNAPAIGCWLIERGRVGIDAFRPGRDPVTVDALGPGDVAGWSWLVPPYRWRFGAVALTDVRAFRLDTVRLRELAAREPAFGAALSLSMLRTVAFRVENLRGRLLDSERVGGRLR